MAGGAQEFKIEEFKQLHEHIRVFEVATVNVFTVSLVASVTLLSAVLAWLFEQHATDPGRLRVGFCYVLLGPGVLSVFTLALINSYKTAIYRMGYYIKVFFEEPGEGPQWHIHLVRYRTLAHGEQNDPAPLILWAMLVISFVLFIVSLVLIRGPEFLSKEWWHFTVPLLLTIEMVRQHLAFASDRKTIEKTWRQIKRQEEQAGQFGQSS